MTSEILRSLRAVGGMFSLNGDADLGLYSQVVLASR